jgi:hypothetical protein
MDRKGASHQPLTLALTPHLLVHSGTWSNKQAKTEKTGRSGERGTGQAEQMKVASSVGREHPRARQGDTTQPPNQHWPDDEAPGPAPRAAASCVS